MTELEQATVNFFNAILATGRDILGHSNFILKVETSVNMPPEDAERYGKIIGEKLQQALDLANKLSQPILISNLSTTVQ